MISLKSHRQPKRTSLKTRQQSQQKKNFLKLIKSKPRSMPGNVFIQDRCKATHLRLSFCLRFSSISGFLAQDAQHRILGARNHWILQDLRSRQGEDCPEVQRVQGADWKAEEWYFSFYSVSRRLTFVLSSGDVSASEKMRMLKDIMAGQNLSEKVICGTFIARALDKIFDNSSDKFFEGLPGFDEDTIWR